MAVQKVQYSNKSVGDMWTHNNANELKEVINNNADELTAMGARQDSLATRQTSVETRMSNNETNMYQNSQDMASLIGSLQRTVSSLRASLDSIGRRTADIQQSQDSGLYITDNEGHVALKYDSNGLDVAKLSGHLVSVLTELMGMGSVLQSLATLRGDMADVKNKTADIQQSQDSGLYITDSEGRVALKYDSNGLDVAKLSGHLVSALTELMGMGSVLQNLATLRGDMTEVKNKTADIRQSMDSGLFVTDASGNVVMKYDGGGFDVAGLSRHFLSLVPNAKTEVSILAVGNSYTVDAYTFLPYICEALGVRLTLSFTFTGGSSLESNWERYQGDNVFTTYRYKDGAWLSQTGRKLPTLLADESWDYVVFQQVSTSSTDGSSIQPWLKNFVDLVASARPNASIGWLATPAYGSANGYNEEQRLAMHDGIWQVVSTKVLGSGVTVVIPEGTAIENARRTGVLGNLGARGQLNRDNIHLDLGIGRYVASLAVYMSMVYPHTGKSVLGCAFRPVWNETVNVSGDANSPARENQLTSVSAQEALVAQKCAVAAYMRQSEACDMSDF